VQMSAAQAVVVLVRKVIAGAAAQIIRVPLLLPAQDERDGERVRECTAKAASSQRRSMRAGTNIWGRGQDQRFRRKEMAKETGRGPADALSKSDRRRKRQQQRSKAIRFEELEHCGEVDAEVHRCSRE